MITPRRSAERGHADHGWLDTYHTFSFAHYHDPDFMGFGDLRVINQDRVQPGRGFGTHGHDNMEIVTYVLEGVLEHRDSMGNGSQIRPGEVQLMSAGTGVTHSELNASREDVLEFLQMWVLPARHDTQPRYGQKRFPDAELADGLRLVASPDGRDGSLRIGQDTCLYAARLDAGRTTGLTLDPGRRAWLHVARGRLTLNGVELGPGDGAAIQDERELRLVGREPAELVLFDLD
jgi:quercetin 2,3-dioxygenase